MEIGGSADDPCRLVFLHEGKNEDRDCRHVVESRLETKGREVFAIVGKTHLLHDDDEEQKVEGQIAHCDREAPSVEELCICKTYVTIEDGLIPTIR